jgi:hypothetical protein
MKPSRYFILQVLAHNWRIMRQHLRQEGKQDGKARREDFPCPGVLRLSHNSFTRGFAPVRQQERELKNA